MSTDNSQIDITVNKNTDVEAATEIHTKHKLKIEQFDELCKKFTIKLEKEINNPPYYNDINNGVHMIKLSNYFKTFKPDWSSEDKSLNKLCKLICSTIRYYLLSILFFVIFIIYHLLMIIYIIFYFLVMFICRCLYIILAVLCFIILCILIFICRGLYIISDVLYFIILCILMLPIKLMELDFSFCINEDTTK